MLLDAQNAMRNSLLGKNSDAAFLSIVADQGQISSEKRLRIYKNNYFVSLISVLAAAYPTIEYLCGPENFKILAREFIRAFPPKEAQLSVYGGEFSDFVQTFEAAIRDLPALADLARLEWARNEAYFAASDPVLEPSILGQIAPEQLGCLYFQTHPACQSLILDFPATAIWDAKSAGLNAQEIADQFQNKQTEFVLIFRKGWKIDHQSVEEAAFVFFSSLNNKLSLEEAAMQAFEKDPEFDLQGCLITFFANGIFSGFSMNSGEE